jgi:hypothetical protein
MSWSLPKSGGERRARPPGGKTNCDVRQRAATSAAPGRARCFPEGKRSLHGPGRAQREPGLRPARTAQHHTPPGRARPDTRPGTAIDLRIGVCERVAS